MIQTSTTDERRGREAGHSEDSSRRTDDVRTKDHSNNNIATSRDAESVAEKATQTTRHKAHAWQHTQDITPHAAHHMQHTTRSTPHAAHHKQYTTRNTTKRSTPTPANHTPNTSNTQPHIPNHTHPLILPISHTPNPP